MKLPLAARKALTPLSGHGLARSPRPIIDESLHSYCIRLGAMHGLPVTTVLRKLGIAPQTDFRVLEQDDDAILAQRLATVTGRNTRVFGWMHAGPAKCDLPIEERCGFCPQCWLERKPPESAFLDRRWADWRVMICTHHDRMLEQWDHPRAWESLFADRARWRTLAALRFPGYWVQLCDELRIDPEQEWREMYPLLVRLQEWVPQLQPEGQRIELRVLVDMALYSQVEWWPSAQSEFMGTLYSIHDQDICHARVLRGSLRDRMKALIIGRHIVEAMLGHTSLLADRFVQDRATHKPTLPQLWWLRRRAIWWNVDYLEALIFLFDLPDQREDSACFRSCRACANAAEVPAAHVPLDLSFACLHDPADPNPKDVLYFRRYTSRCPRRPFPRDHPLNATHRRATGCFGVYPDKDGVTPERVDQAFRDIASARKPERSEIIERSSPWNWEIESRRLRAWLDRCSSPPAQR